jgi:hypothetical protein
MTHQEILFSTVALAALLGFIRWVFPHINWNFFKKQG